MARSIVPPPMKSAAVKSFGYGHADGIGNTGLQFQFVR